MFSSLYVGALFEIPSASVSDSVWLKLACILAGTVAL
jgi:hypothetical protein